MLLPLLMLLSSQPVVSLRSNPSPDPDPPIHVWLSSDGRYDRGDHAKVYARGAQDAYLIVLHASPDGRVRGRRSRLIRVMNSGSTVARSMSSRGGVGTKHSWSMTLPGQVPCSLRGPQSVQRRRFRAERPLGLRRVGRRWGAERSRSRAAGHCPTDAARLTSTSTTTSPLTWSLRRVTPAGSVRTPTPWGGAMGRGSGSGGPTTGGMATAGGAGTGRPEGPVPVHRASSSGYHAGHAELDFLGSTHHHGPSAQRSGAGVLALSDSAGSSCRASRGSTRRSSLRSPGR